MEFRFVQDLEIVSEFTGLSAEAFAEELGVFAALYAVGFGGERKRESRRNITKIAETGSLVEVSPCSFIECSRN